MKNIKKVLAAVLMIAVMFSITGCDSSDYKKAAQLMADGDYAAAVERLTNAAQDEAFTAAVLAALHEGTTEEADA